VIPAPAACGHALQALLQGALAVGIAFAMLRLVLALAGPALFGVIWQRGLWRLFGNATRGHIQSQDAAVLSYVPRGPQSPLVVRWIGRNWISVATIAFTNGFTAAVFIQVLFRSWALVAGAAALASCFATVQFVYALREPPRIADAVYRAFDESLSIAFLLVVVSMFMF